MNQLQGIDAVSIEYDMPLWMRISEAYPQVQRDPDAWKYKDLRILIDEVMTGKMTNKTLAKKMGIRKDSVVGMKTRLLLDLSGKKAPAKKRGCRFDSEIREIVQKYVVKYGCAGASRLSGRHRDSIRNAANRMGYQYVGPKQVGRGHWVAPIPV